MILNEKRLQQEYIQQLTQRLQQDLYDKGNISVDGRNWALINKYYAGHDVKVTCDHVKANKKRCNKRIHHVFVMQNGETNELVKVGSTCSQKLLGAESTLSIDELNAQRESITRLHDTLMMGSDYSDGSATIEVTPYTGKEKRRLIQEAMYEHILPIELRKLIEYDIPLTMDQYRQLEQNLTKLKNEKYDLSMQHVYSHHHDSKAFNVRESFVPADPIETLLDGTGIVVINGDTTTDDLMSVVTTLTQYVSMMAVNDKRKTLNYSDIRRPIEHYYDLSAALKEELGPILYGLALEYMSNQPSLYQMLHVDTKKMEFIYSYVD